MSASNSTTVSVIIPHYNDLANLTACLALLARQDYPRDLVEIVVADNNSQCGLDALRASVGSGVTCVAAPEQGAGPARNVGALASRGEVLAFIDSDCAPEADWLSRGVARLQGYDFIGGRVKVLPQKPGGPLSPTEAFEMVFAFNFESYVRDKGFTGSGNMFVRRAVFEAVGGFRKTVSEDMEWSHRATSMGYRLGYAADVVVGHPARRDFRELSGKWLRLVQEGYAYHVRSGRGAASWVGRSLAVLLSPFPHVWKIMRAPTLTSVRERLGAIGVLFAIRLCRFGWMLRALRTRPAAN